MTNVVPLHGVNEAIENAPVAPPALEPPDGGGSETPRRQGGLPDDCPVTPLGLNDDGQFYYLDAIQQLRVLKEKDHSRLGLLALFNQRWHVLQATWPRMTKDGVITGWRPERAAEELISACGRKGPLDIADRVRGPGAWRGADGQLVLHCGDMVLHGTQWRNPGEADGFIYPAAAAIPPPAELAAAGGSAGPAEDLLQLLRAWNWHRPEIDPVLLLGWIGAAKIGGALPWRPTVWLTGDLASGKSTLLELMTMIFGPNGVHAVTDATPAGIWQRVRHSSLPVMLDEAEAEEDPRRMRATVRLARTASSGGVTYRGGSEHHPVTFTIRCCFLFSSILIPGLLPQDWSRIAALELDPVTAGAAPKIDPRKMRACGEALTRRLVDNWPRYAGIFERYRAALGGAGHKARGADQYGSLLACAELLRYDDEPHSDSLALWAERLRPALTAGYGDERRDHQRCIDRILSTIVDPYRNGGRRSIAQWLRDAIQPEASQPHTANDVLETYGLSVLIEPGSVHWLRIANTHAGLAQLFKDTHWAPTSGTSAPWVQALRRFPLSIAESGVRFNGFKSRCTRLPLQPLLDGADE